MERQHLVLVEAVARAERVPQLHRKHCAKAVEPVDSHSAPLRERHRSPRAPLVKRKSSGSTVRFPLPSMARAGFDPVVSILQYRASRVEPSRFHCPTLREHGRTPLERFTGSQSSGQTVAFPLPSMPRAGLTPIGSILDHATRTVGALDFNREALRAPGRTGPSRSLESISSGRTRKIQCTSIAHVRLNPVIATKRHRSCGFELFDAIRRGYPEAVGELTGGGSDRFPGQRSVRHSRPPRMREIRSCIAWSAADNRTSAPATQLAIRSVWRSRESRLRNRNSCRAIVDEQTSWPRPNWDCHSPCSAHAVWNRNRDLHMHLHLHTRPCGHIFRARAQRHEPSSCGTASYSIAFVFVVAQQATARPPWVDSAYCHADREIFGVLMGGSHDGFSWGTIGLG